MLKNPLQETAEDHLTAPQEGQLSNRPSLKSKSRSLPQSLATLTCGGMAGLVCALSLDKRGVKSTVFDTGNLGTPPLVFDHATQFFTVNDSQFGQLVDGWLERGLVRLWEGVFGELEVGGQFVLLPSSP